MKKLLLTTLGLTLLLKTYVYDAFGISTDSFVDDVYRPDNLPAGRSEAAGAETKINEALQFFINLILYASGGAAVLFLVIGGIRYITSFGNQERMDAAKKTITYALIGLAAVILAYAAVQNVIDLIYRATT